MAVGFGETLPGAGGPTLRSKRPTAPLIAGLLLTLAASLAVQQPAALYVPKQSDRPQPVAGDER